MTDSSDHWLDRLIQRCAKTIDAGQDLPAEALAEIINGSSQADWASLSDAQRQALDDRLNGWQSDRPWLTERPKWGRAVAHWRQVLRHPGASGTPAHAPHWLARVIAKELSFRTQGDNGRARLMAEILIGAREDDWRDARLDFSTVQRDGGTLLHRAAREWPEALSTLLKVHKGAMRRDNANRSVADVLQEEWGRDQYPTVVQMLDSLTAAADFDAGLPPAAGQAASNGRL